MELNGIPLHPLIVHVAVAFAPLAAILAITHAWVRRWRWALRWPMALTALVAAGSVQLASMSGKDLKHRLGLQSALMERHEMWAGRLVVTAWVLLAVVLLAWWTLPVRNPVAGGADRASGGGILDRVLAVLLTLTGLVLLLVVFQTGDAGARAVWVGR